MADIAAKFFEECQLVASLKHPNIAQFLGVFFLPDKQTPLLVMENLEMKLDDLLESIPKLFLETKLSILEDICIGLAYLHGRQPPAIHGELTAKNILLNFALKAKLTNVGSSHILKLKSGELFKTFSQVSGSLLYMPPEALTDIPHESSLDMFSFGHLALYTLTQVSI